MSFIQKVWCSTEVPYSMKGQGQGVFADGMGRWWCSLRSLECSQRVWRGYRGSGGVCRGVYEGVRGCSRSGCVGMKGQGLSTVHRSSGGVCRGVPGKRKGVVFNSAFISCWAREVGGALLVFMVTKCHLLFSCCCCFSLLDHLAINKAS